MRAHFYFLNRAILIGSTLSFSGTLLAEKPAESAKPAVKAVEQAEKTKKSSQTAEREKKAEAVKKKAPVKAKKLAEGKETQKEKEAKPAAEKEEASKEGEAKIHTVEAKPFKVTAKLSGLIEGQDLTPISMDLKRWADLNVISVMDHGSEVKEGDRIIELDTEPLEKKIRELREGMPLKELDLQIAQLELEKMEQTTPISLEQGRRSMKQADQDLEYFVKVSRPMRERDAKEDLQSTRNYLSYAEEELKQLKKMYEADDLTEETEEIVLKRAQNSVDSYTWMLEQTEARTKRTLSTSLPREHTNLTSQFELKEINATIAEETMTDALEKKELEVEAKRRGLEEAELALDEYVQDLEKMDVRAPRSGVIYYGMSQRGKWETATSVSRKLIPGGKLAMKEIVMTLVNPKEVKLRLAVPENKLKGLKKGLSGKVTMQWDPDSEMSGKLESVSYVPFADSTFDASVSIRNTENSKVVPGMKADVELTLYEKKSALAIPKEAITKENERETVTFSSGRVRRIKTGQVSGNLVEVVEGLKAGDEILVKAESKEESDGDKKQEAKSGDKSEAKSGDKKK